MTHRRERNAALKAGLSATLSALALIVLLPIDGSSAQAGVRPRRTTASSRPGEPSARRTTLPSAAPLRLARGTPPRSSQRVIPAVRSPDGCPAFVLAAGAGP